jgi:hypothetical protein
MSGLIAGVGLAAGLIALGADGGVVPLPPAVPPKPATKPAIKVPAAPPLLMPIKGGELAPADNQYQLHRAEDGSNDLIYETRKFKARIARDGSVSFQDRPFGISSWSMFPFAPVNVPTGRPTLQGALRDWLSRRRPPPNPPPAPLPGQEPIQTITPRMWEYRPDPREACQFPRSCSFEPVIVVGPAGNGLDLTDELLRFNGEDPYRRDKALFLAGTRDLRDRMAARAAAEDVRVAKADLEARLYAIACDTNRSERERRAVLVALREELDGPTPAAHEAAAFVTRFMKSFFDDDDPKARCAAR